MFTSALPEKITDEAMLEDLLSSPSAALGAMMPRLDGDIIILGIAGKMGVTLGLAAVRAAQAAGVRKKIIGVSRFSDPAARERLEARGVETIAADLLDRDAVDKLPRIKNVVYMAGRKFGTSGDEEFTWAMNALVPGYVAHHFRDSRIVAFSTGCVYPLALVGSGGSVEEDEPGAVGEYAQSCLGRERIFQYFSQVNRTPVCLLRLNYAIDLRYGVLYDIGSKVWAREPVNLSAGQFNAIWQGDANNQALLALEHCESPAKVLNITGPETISTRYTAEEFGRIMGQEVKFDGEERARQYLNNAVRAHGLFGYPAVPLATMIRWQAEWLMAGGRSLGKPTHFEVSDGQY